MGRTEAYKTFYIEERCCLIMRFGRVFYEDLA